MQQRIQRSAKLQIYQDAAGQWRWRLRAANGRNIACSGEGYRRESAVRRAAQRVQAYLRDERLRWLSTK